MAIELTADQLGQMTAVLRLSGNRQVVSERRRTPRLDVKSSVSVAMVNDGESGPAMAMRIRDLSPRGVALLHTEAMKNGQQFVLTLQRSEGEPVKILCTAVHSRAGKGRLHTIGAEFTCTLTDLPAPLLSTNAEQERIRSSMLD
jgi:hypothetical protein